MSLADRHLSHRLAAKYGTGGRLGWQSAVDYRTSKRMMMHIETCKKVVEEAKGEFPVIAFVFGPLGTLSMLRNQQEMYMDFYDDPDAVHKAAKEVLLPVRS